MVTPVPTFRSDRQTQAGGMGIVSFNATRQLGEAMKGVGQLFDQVTAFQDKKANEVAEREMQKQGQELARMKGFDPNQIKDPVTAADRVYRQAALQTYAISLESSLTNKVNDSYIQNMRNPEGFKRQAQAYVDKTVQSVPFELRNGVSKMGMSAIDGRYMQMRLENQRQAMAEMENAEKVFLGTLVDQFALAKTPEERQVVDAKVRSTIANSATYLTPQGKMAAYQDVQRKMAYSDTFNKVVTDDMTPMEAIERLESVGIAPTSEMVSQIYGAAGREFAYKKAEFQANEAQRKQSINDATNTMLLEINKYKGQPGFQDIYNMIQTKGDAIILSAGGTADDLISFQKSAQKIAFGSQEDNPNTKFALDAAIFNLDPNARAKIDQAFQAGQITPQTYQGYIESETRARAGVGSNPILKKYIENEFIPQYAPMAVKAVPGWENVYTQQQVRDAILQDKEKADSFVAKAVALSQSKPMDEVIRELSSDIRANQTPTPAKERAQVLGNSPNRRVLEDMYSRENFDLTYVDLKTRSRKTYSVNNAPDAYKEILKGPWSQANYMARVKLMAKQNAVAIAAGLDAPYNSQLINEVLETWQ